MEALKAEYGLQEAGARRNASQTGGMRPEEPMMYAMMKLMAIQMELQLPGLMRWLQKIQADAVVYCPLACLASAV